MHPKDAARISNSVDPDQEQSDLGLHCLPRPFCPNVMVRVSRNGQDSAIREINGENTVYPKFFIIENDDLHTVKSQIIQTLEKISHDMTCQNQTNKMAVCLAKTQFSLGISPV